MAIAERSAVTTWNGSLAGGSGVIRAADGELGEIPVTWQSRTAEPGGKTSPEELAAAAHSSCFAMALALRLGEHKAIPQRLTVSATVTLDEVGGLPTIVSSDLRVRARVPGLGDASFQAILDEAAALCPVSRLYAGARISVDGVLET